MSQKNDIDRYASYLLLAAILLGLALRLCRLDHQSLWIDELFTVVPTNPSNSIQSIIDYAKGDQPPLLFLLINFWFKVFGYTEYAARVFSVFLGTLGIVGIYALGRELAGKSTGLFAAFLLAVNNFHIQYSQDVRFYGLLFLLTTLSYLFFLRGLKYKDYPSFIFYIIFTSALLYTHYYSFFVVAAQALTFVFVIFRHWDGVLLLRSIVSFSLVCLSYLPWVEVIIQDIYDVLPQIKPVESAFVLRYVYVYFGKDALTLSMLIIGFFVYLRHHPKNEYANQISALAILFCWICVTYGLPYIRSILISPMIEFRYTIITLPAWIILFSLGWPYLKSAKIKAAVLSLVLTISIVNISLVRKYYSKITKEQWREVSNCVIAMNTENLPIFSPLRWHFSFYFKDQMGTLNDFSLDQMQKTDRFWYVVAHIREDEVEAQINTLTSDFVPVQRKDFYGATAVLFEHKSLQK